MKMTVDDAPKNIITLIEQITSARKAILEHRLKSMSLRYPEIEVPFINKISDDEIIVLALQREWAHQVNVESDIYHGKS